jgi:multiple sugar transport system substrate-binding protein
VACITPADPIGLNLRTKALKKPIELTSIICVAILLLVSGCASGRQEVNLRIGNWGGAGDESDFSRAQQALYREFEAQNPGVKIRIEGVPGSQEYVSKMLLSFIAGTEPDILALDASSAAVFINNGVLKDLKPLADRDKTFSFDDYFPNVVAIATRGEKVYAVPSDFTPMVMYYNKRLFRESGVPFPKPGWTYDDFLESAKKLTKGNQYGFKFSNWMPGWVTWIWNQGGDVLDPNGTTAKGALDSKTTREGLQYINDLIRIHHVAPSLSQSASLGVDLFTNGQAAMEISGHWALVGYSVAPKDAKGVPLLKMEDVGVVELPTQLKKGVTVMYESGLAIGKNSKHSDIAWKFIRFMTSAHAQGIMNKTGIAVSARKDVAAERGKLDPREAEFLKIVPSARSPWGAKVEGYDNVETVGQKMMDNILQGSLTLDEAIKRAVNEINEDFRKR